MRELFTLSVDYEDDDRETNLFFAEVQNKLLFAATGRTAAELIVSSADPDQPNMALNNWSGSRVRKHDVIVAKNYLQSKEIDTLNRLVVIFLEQAELRVQKRKQLSLDYWRQNVDRLLEFNERPILQGAGSISHDDMKSIAQDRYATFNKNCKKAEALEADEEDVKELENVEKRLKKGGKK